MFNQISGVFVVFTTQANEVLMVNRREGLYSPKRAIHYVAGVLELPGGIPDPNDKTIVDTAEREVSEETGFTINKDRLEPIGYFNGRNGKVFFYHYRLTNKETSTMTENLTQITQEEDAEHTGFDFYNINAVIGLLNRKQSDNGHKLRYVLTLPGDIVVHVLHEKCGEPLPEGITLWNGIDGNLVVMKGHSRELGSECEEFVYKG